MLQTIKTSTAAPSKHHIQDRAPNLILPNSCLLKADVAAIARGATEVRVRPERRDRMARAVDRLNAKIAAYLTARSARKDAEKPMGDAGRYRTVLDTAQPLFHGPIPLCSVVEVETAIKRQRAICRREIAHYRKLLREHRNHTFNLETRQRLDSKIRMLVEIPAVARRLTSEMRKHVARVNGVRRRHHIASLHAKESDALAAMHSAFDAMKVLPIISAADAAGLMRGAAIISKSNVFHLGALTEVLERAADALTKH